jgi:hypothetical protein
MRFSVITLLLGLSLFSCKVDVDLIGEYQVTPIVIGLLDQSDSLHFIKINKTFLGKGNAFDMAQVPDSSYFDDVDATITEVLANGNIGRVWQLRDTIIGGRSTDGVFFAPDQKVYYFATPTFQNDPINSLQPTATYRFQAIINGGEHVVTGETELMRDVNITAPSSQSSYMFRGNQNDYRAVPFTWTKGNARRYNFKMEFHYRETDVNGAEYDKFFVWNLGEVFSNATNNVTVFANGELFYQLVRNNIPVDNAIVKREHTYFRLILTAGSEELDNFIAANQPSTSLAQNKPSYTNLEGGIGIFSSRLTIRLFKYFVQPPGINPNFRSLDQRSTRELCEGQYTGFLKFCSSHTQDTNPNLPGNPQTFVCQ